MYNLLTTMYQQQGILINHRMEIMVSNTPKIAQNIITKQVPCINNTLSNPEVIKH